jgi:hypothetical protein
MKRNKLLEPPDELVCGGQELDWLDFFSTMSNFPTFVCSCRKEKVAEEYKQLLEANQDEFLQTESGVS